VSDTAEGLAAAISIAMVQIPEWRSTRIVKWRDREVFELRRKAKTNDDR